MQLRCALRFSVERITDEGMPQMRKARANDVPPTRTDERDGEKITSRHIPLEDSPRAPATISLLPTCADSHLPRSPVSLREIQLETAAFRHSVDAPGEVLLVNHPFPTSGHGFPQHVTRGGICRCQQGP